MHKLNIIFGITQKLLCIKPSKLLRWKITKKGIFLNVLQPKERLVASSRPLLFFIILSIKRAWEQREKSSWLFKDFPIVFFHLVKRWKKGDIIINCTIGLVSRHSASFQQHILSSPTYVYSLYLLFFIFSLNDSLKIIIKNAFYFIHKALFALEIFKVLYFGLPLFFPCQLLL